LVVPRQWSAYSGPLMGSLARPRTLASWAVLGVATTGLALRIWATAGIWPAGLSTHDTAAYVRAAHYGLSKDPLEPSGFPIFLRLMHSISAQLAVTVAVQHVLGMAAGALLYLAVRRLGGNQWLALGGAAAIWLNGDQIFLEQTLLSEALFVFLLMLALYAVVRSREPGSGFVWPAMAVAATIALPFVRGVADPLVLLLLAFLAYGVWRARGPWLLRLGVAAAAGVLVVAAYAGIRHHDTGSWSIKTQGSGWPLYSRVAQFADCSKFTPPAGTRPLCESTPKSRRASSDTYAWQNASPAIRTFGEPPRGSSQVGHFALAAIEHQPGDYAHAVLIDLERYVDQNAGAPKPGDYGGPDTLSFSHSGSVDGEGSQQVRAYYHPFRVHAEAASPLADYQSVFRMHGWLLALLTALALAGAVFARGPLRYGVALFGLSGLVLLAFPALVSTTTWRYTIPAGPLLVAAGAIGAAALWAACARSLSRVTPAGRTAPTP
jgi:hypothetical protein